MTLPFQDTIRVRLIMLFRKYPVMTVAEACSALNKGQNTCTLQAVYKEFRMLAADNMVQKVGKSYTLNASWVLQLQLFSNRLVKSVFSEEVGPFLLASHGQKQVWKFNSLLELNDFWAHLDLYIVRTIPHKTILAWNPYVWFFLFHAKAEETFLKSLKMLGGQFCVIVGGDNFLNRLAIDFYHKHDVLYSYSPPDFAMRMDTNVNVVGDYIVTVKMGKSAHQKMDALYKQTTSMATISIPDITELFVREGQSTLTLEYNPQKAAKIRRVFSRHFGGDF
jgi:hypothetical protein